MPVYEESVFIERPVEDVFTYMDDVARESEWQPNIRKAELIPADRAPGVGSKKRYQSEFLGRTLENTYVIRTYEPNRKIVYESTPDSAVTARAEIDFEAQDGGTRVTMAFQGKTGGLLRLVPSAVIESVLRGELRASLARLKTLLERGS